MAPRSEFQRSLDKADAKLKRASSLLARTQRLADCGKIPEAFNTAFTFAAEAEKLTLLARTIPAYTGHPRALELSEELVAETVPVEMGYTSRAGSCCASPHCCQKRKAGPPAIYGTPSTLLCAVSLPGSCPTSIPTAC